MGKKSKGFLVKKAVKAYANNANHLQAAGMSIRKALSIASFATIFVATKVARSGKLAAGDPWWWAVAGAFCAGMLAMWVAILMFFEYPTRRYPTIAKILLCINVAALAVLFAVGDLDPISLLRNLM